MLENAEAIEAWNTVLYDKFLRFRHIVTAGLGRHGNIAMEHYPPPRGAKVLDLGCGFGDTTTALAGLVGPSGKATGVDAAPRFIEGATAEVKALGITNADFAVRDVQSEALGGPYDYVFSRFGTMFFASPVAALRNVRKSMAQGAQLVMVVWRRKLDNSWVALAEERVSQIVPPPESKNAPTCGPGPFSMADGNIVTDVMQGAGFSRVCLERADADLCIGANLDDAVEFAMALGPAGELLRLAGAEAEKRRPEVIAALREVLGPLQRPDGVYGASSVWIVTARA